MTLKIRRAKCDTGIVTTESCLDFRRFLETLHCVAAKTPPVGMTLLGESYRQPGGPSVQPPRLVVIVSCEPFFFFYP